MRDYGRFDCRPTLFQPFTLTHVGRMARAGSLLDSNFQIFTNDDTDVGRDGVVRDLKTQAIKYGFARCQVRNYFDGREERYETMFDGPLPEQIAAAS
jgi:hypothetical protein